MPTQSRYYPSAFKVPELHQDLRILFDHMYDQQDRNKASDARMAGMEAQHGQLAEKVANGPSNTKIAGLNVKGMLPSKGTAVSNLGGLPTQCYNASSGEIEWYIPSS